MKVLFAFFTALPLGVSGAPLSPAPIEWQRSFGVSEQEDLYAVEQTSDGGYILGGISRSPPGGNKTAPIFGDFDYWIVRLDSQGNQLWDKSFGGTSRESLHALRPTADGGFILTGGSESGPSGNKTSPHYGLAADYWWCAWIATAIKFGIRVMAVPVTT